MWNYLQNTLHTTLAVIDITPDTHLNHTCQRDDNAHTHRLPKSLANLSLAKFKTENESLARLARLARPAFRYSNLSNPYSTN